MSETLTIPPELAKKMFVAREEMEASFNKQLGTDGWVYRDIPRLLNADWDKFLGIVGDGNHKLLVGSSNGTKRRGQIMISPAGMERLKEHAASHPPTNPKGVETQ